MFDADQVRLLMKAAVEFDRHGTLPTDTAMAIEEISCCEECLAEMLDAATQDAL